MTTCCRTVSCALDTWMTSWSPGPILNLRSTGSAKPALALTDEIKTPEFGVIRAARASAVAVKTVAATTNRTTKRLLVMVTTILDCLIIRVFSFSQEQMGRRSPSALAALLQTELRLSPASLSGLAQRLSAVKPLARDVGTGNFNCLHSTNAHPQGKWGHKLKKGSSALRFVCRAYRNTEQVYLIDRRSS